MIFPGSQEGYCQRRFTSHTEAMHYSPKRLPSPVRLLLVCVDDVSPVNEFQIPRFPVTLGRGERADLRFDDCWASRVHCLFEEQDGRIRVTDLNSGNGTFLNSQPISSAWLKDGDHLTIGISTFEVILQTQESDTLILDECEPSLSSPEISL